MKNKKWLALILCALMVLTVAACNKSTDASVDDEPVVAPEGSTEPDKSSGSTKVYDYENKGELFFDYPESYSYNDDTGMLTFVNPDENLRIMVRATVNNLNDYENKLDYYKSYNTYKEFRQEEITIAGYDAFQIYYLDDWGDYVMSVLIKLGDDSGLFSGISFDASSSAGENLLSDSEMLNMIESVRITK